MHFILDDNKLIIDESNILFEIKPDLNYDKTRKTPIIRTMNNPIYSIKFDEENFIYRPDVIFHITELVADDSSNVSNAYIYDIENKLSGSDKKWLGVTLDKTESTIHVIFSFGPKNTIATYNDCKEIISKEEETYSVYLHISQLHSIADYCDITSTIKIWAISNIELSHDSFSEVGEFWLYSEDNNPREISGELYIKHGQNIYISGEFFASNLNVVYEIDPTKASTLYVPMLECALEMRFKSQKIIFLSKPEEGANFKRIIKTKQIFNTLLASFNEIYYDVNVTKSDSNKYCVYDISIGTAKNGDFCLIEKGGNSVELCQDIPGVRVINSLIDIQKHIDSISSTITIYVQENYEFSLNYSFISTKHYIDATLTTKAPEKTIMISGNLNLPEWIHLIIDDSRLIISQEPRFSIRVDLFMNNFTTPLVKTKNNPIYNLQANECIDRYDKSRTKFKCIELVNDESLNTSNVNFSGIASRVGPSYYGTVGKYEGKTVNNVGHSIYYILSNGDLKKVVLFNNSIGKVTYFDYKFSCYIHVSLFKDIYSIVGEVYGFYEIFIYEDLCLSKEMMPANGLFMFSASYSDKRKLLNKLYIHHGVRIIINQMIDISNLEIVFEIDPTNTSIYDGNPVLTNKYDGKFHKLLIHFKKLVYHPIDISSLVSTAYNYSNTKDVKFETNIERKDIYLISSKVKFLENYYCYSISIDFSAVSFCLINDLKDADTLCESVPYAFPITSLMETENYVLSDSSTIYVQNDYEFLPNDSFLCSENFPINLKTKFSKRVKISGTFVIPKCMTVDIDDENILINNDPILKFYINYEFVYHQNPIISTRNNPSYIVQLNKSFPLSKLGYFNSSTLVHSTKAKSCSNAEIIDIKKLYILNSSISIGITLVDKIESMEIFFLKGPGNVICLFSKYPRFIDNNLRCSAFLPMTQFKNLLVYKSNEEEFTFYVMDSINFDKEHVLPHGKNIFETYNDEKQEITGNLYIDHGTNVVLSRTCNDSSLEFHIKIDPNRTDDLIAPVLRSRYTGNESYSCISISLTSKLPLGDRLVLKDFIHLYENELI